MAHYIDSFPGREIIINNKKHLYFGGTAYLGLQTDEAFQQIFIDNIKKYGTNYGASRKSNVRITIFNKAEKYLAGLVESASSITLSSGYLAGQLVSQFFNDSNYTLFYAPNTHSALYQSQAKPYTTYEALNLAVREHLKVKKAVPVVFMDSIDFSGCNFPNFIELKALPLDKIILVADDSHGIGIVGENGQGVYKILTGFKPKELIVCCSLGKGFGVQAGAIFGEQERINQLKNTNFFGGASPATPASMAALLSANEIYRKRRGVLKEHIDYFVQNVHLIQKFSLIENHPTFSYSNTRLTKHLETNGILVTDFSYPTEEATLMSRIVLNASHLKEDVQYLVNTINTYFS